MLLCKIARQGKTQKCKGLGCCRVKVMGMERKQAAVVKRELPGERGWRWGRAVPKRRGAI